MRKVFLDKLPHGGKGINKKYINWCNSIGYKVKFIYDNIQGEIEIIDYNYPKIKIKYLNKDFYNMQTSDFIKCRLGILLDVKTSEFKIEIGQTFKDDKRDITIIDRKYIKDKNDVYRKYYKYKCNKCGFDGNEHYKDGKYQKEHWTIESSLLSNHINCACCNNKITVNTINDMWTTNSELAKLLADPQDGYKYTEHSGQYVNWKCSDCGNIIKSKKINQINAYGLSCPKCSDGISIPEKIMYIILQELKIDFEYHKIFEWSKNVKHNNPKLSGNKEYDFYFKINNEAYIIETHGGQHYQKSFSSCGGRTLKEEQENDKIKYELAIDNKIKNKHYIVIDCNKSELEWIKNSIFNNEKLNNVFNLNKINWLKIGEFANNNFINQICKYKKNNPDMTTTKIGSIFKLNRNTISRYLKRGASLGWCDYNPKEEKIKSRQKINKNGKLVAIFKDEKSLGVFPSCSELERQSEEKFGVKLNNANISEICNNKKPQYKGFTFKYI